VVAGSGAWVFSGPSGSGKTTIAGLAGDRVVLNDETIALRPAPRGWRACATPFYGSGGPSMARVNDSAPVRGLCFLRKSSRFAHRRLTPTEVVSRAFPEVMLPKRDARVAERLLATLASLAAVVPAWELAFAPDPAIWSYLDGLSTESFPLRKSVPWRTLDTEALVVDVKGGLLYPLNSVGARIWDLCDGARSVDEIVGVIADEFAAPETTIRTDAIEFIERLADAKLISIERRRRGESR
jgi:hypothetical protein